MKELARRLSSEIDEYPTEARRTLIDFQAELEAARRPPPEPKPARARPMRRSMLAGLFLLLKGTAAG